MNDPADSANETNQTAAVEQQQTSASGSPEAAQADRPRARIKIGSQRQASGVFRTKSQFAPPQAEAPKREFQPEASARNPAATQQGDVKTSDSAKPVESQASEGVEPTPGDSPTTAGPSPGAKTAETARDVPHIPVPRSEPIPKPSVRDAFTDDMEQELEAAMGGVGLDAMLTPGASTSGAELEADSLHRGRVLYVRGSNVFIDLGGRNQGLVPAAQFEVLPKPDDVLEVSVRKFDAAEGLYELSVPHAAVSVAGWDQISEGMVVEAAVTGHNSGGLEVEVNKLRGFIPISQVSIYRVKVLAEFVGQRLTCVVTEVNPQARNLVLSRRAMLERERAEAKTKLLEELDVGQIRDGVVTRLQPFGAFVDLGGIDGLIHVSQMSWDRVADPSQVLEVGQKIKVRVTKMDRDTGKIGLSYRESWENPWDSAERKYTPKSKVSGTVSKLTDFGAFVKLEPGIEGLVHISELAHRRVFRSSDVVKEGQEVEVLVISLDKEQQRISLSLKALEARPEPTGKKKEEEDLAIPTPIPQRKNQGPLKGGISGPSGGEKFGLKW
ncbi:MAG: S1 RNA-binding domain-containing protein [Planctomycetes bacterium]|nr:S1 RNA-binding domain-containing protein [Planctomycetota bacterium]